MKVIVSGAEGNLGKHIVKNSKLEIVGLNRGDWDLQGSKFGNADVFVHCAYDLKKKINNEPVSVLESNVLTVAKALEFVLKNKIKKFIFISSCSVYGTSSDSNENQKCTPITINGMIKLLCEKVIIDFCKENKLDYLILRAFNTFGGDDAFSVVSKIKNSIKNNKSFVLNNNGIARRDFIHVDDLAKVVCHYCENKSEYKILNVGNGVTVSIDEILKVAKNKFPKLEIVNSTNSEDVEYSRANIDRLRKECDFKFKSILNCFEADLDEGK